MNNKHNINVYHYNTSISDVEMLDKQQYYTCEFFNKYIYGEFEKLNKDTIIKIGSKSIKIEFEFYESSLHKELDPMKRQYLYMYTFKVKYPLYVPIIKEYPGTISNVTITQRLVPKIDFKLPKDVSLPELVPEITPTPSESIFPKHNFYPSYKDDNSHVNWYKRDSKDMKRYSNKSHVHNNFYLCDKDEYMDFRINGQGKTLEFFFKDKIEAINNRNIVWCFSMKKPVKVGSTIIYKHTYDEEDYCKIYSKTSFETIENFDIDDINKNYYNVKKYNNTYNSRDIHYMFDKPKDLDKIRNIVEEKLLLHAYNNCQNINDDYYFCFDNVKFECHSTPRMFEYSKKTVLMLTVDIIKIKIN